MPAFLPGLPGIDDVRNLARHVDTARHRGVPNGCVLELDLQEVPQETAGFDPLAIIHGRRPAVLGDLVDGIYRAAEDERVAGLIARVQLPAAPAGPIQELRAAIETFAATKPTVAWAETYPGTMSYYLASVFGEIWLQPSGTVGLVGFATSAMFLHSALDKAGIEAQVVARDEYKSAANLFTQDSYTDAHREADTRLVESLHEQVWRAIAESRGLTTETLDELADRAPLLRAEAAEAGLVDRVGFRDEAYARIAELVAAEPVSPTDADEGPPRLYLSRYAHATGPSRPGLPLPAIPGRRQKPAIAVVTVAGPIVSGRGGPLPVLFGRSTAGGDTIAASLREATADDEVVAIVLRVDSPGGSVTASETIWRAVGEARKTGKPVVASMGAVAASGGYYVAMGADAIVANPGTITGSIGVVTGKLVARGLKDRLGIGSDAVRTHANADAFSPNAPFTPEQHARLEAEADLFYTDFVGRVADGRKLAVDAVDTVARGRVWTGADALGHGLVDELGGLHTAIDRAKALAGLEPDAEVRLPRYPGSSWLEYLRPRSSSAPAAALTEAAGVLLTRSLVGVVDQLERSFSGANVLWLGEPRR